MRERKKERDSGVDSCKWVSSFVDAVVTRVVKKGKRGGDVREEEESGLGSLLWEGGRTRE